MHFTKPNAVVGMAPFLRRLVLVVSRAAGRGRLDMGCNTDVVRARLASRSEEHTSELQSLMRISYAVFCLKKKTLLRFFLSFSIFSFSFILSSFFYLFFFFFFS